MTKSLDLGCGPNPKNPFLADEVFGIDINTFNNPNIKIADLAIDPIPFEGNTFDYISGFDFLEHIPRILYIGRERKQPFIDVMSEIWRVLKPGGETFFATPAYPTPEAFQDPQIRRKAYDQASGKRGSFCVYCLMRLDDRPVCGRKWLDHYKENELAIASSAFINAIRSCRLT